MTDRHDREVEIIDGMDFDPTTRANAIAALLPEVPGLLEVYSGVDEDRIDAARQDILDSVAFDEKKIDYVDFTTSVNRRALRILGDRERRRTRIEAAMREGRRRAAPRRIGTWAAGRSPSRRRGPMCALEHQMSPRRWRPRRAELESSQVSEVRGDAGR